MHTKDKLAEELLLANLGAMAVRAREGHYHDFLSPLDTPGLQLLADLAKAGTPAALALRERAKQGEFDATLEEADDWSESAEGRELLAGLKRERPDHKP